MPPCEECGKLGEIEAGLVPLAVWLARQATEFPAVAAAPRAQVIQAAQETEHVGIRGTFAFSPWGRLSQLHSGPPHLAEGAPGRDQTRRTMRRPRVAHPIEVAAYS